MDKNTHKDTHKDWFGIESMFEEHEPKAADAKRYAAINDAARQLAKVIAENAPENSSATRHAIRAAQEAALWAKEAIRTWRPARMVETGMFSGLFSCGLIPSEDSTSL